MDNIPTICDSIIIYEALQMRQIFLDAFSDGLEVFKLKSAINVFPELFKDLFVASDKFSPDEVLGVLRFPLLMSDEEVVIADYLRNCILKFTEKGTV